MTRTRRLTRLVVTLGVPVLGCWFGSVAPRAEGQTAHSIAGAGETCAGKKVVGTMGKVVGEAQIKRGHEVIRARSGTPVHTGDVVTTRKGQRASITTCGGSSVYVNQETSARMTSRTAIRLQRGETAERMASKKAGKIQTGEATVQAHGATLDVQASRGKSTVLVATGSAEVSNKRGKVRLSRNQETRVLTGKAPEKPAHVDAQRAISWANSLAGNWQVLTKPGALNEPQRLAIATNGTIYVADLGTSGGRVVKLSSSGQVQVTWPLQGGNAAPAAVAIDPQKNLLVTDAAGGSVQKLSASGQILAVYSLRNATLGQSVTPAGIAVDKAGTMYVVDEVGDTVLKLSSSGQLLATFGGAGSGRGQFQSPQGIALDGAGNMYVADEFNDRVQKLSPTGQALATWGTGDSSSPTDVALDAQGDIYIAEANAERIQELSPSGEAVWAWQSDPLGTLTDPGEFNRPYGITLDKLGRLYVADRYNARIQVLTGR